MGKGNLEYGAEGDFMPKKEQVTGRQKKYFLTIFRLCLLAQCNTDDKIKEHDTYSACGMFGLK